MLHNRSHLAPAVQKATSPFQYALTTKAGGECVAHAIQSLTDLDSRATVLSIVASAHSTWNRELRCWVDFTTSVGATKHPPFVLQFYSEPSQHFWTDDSGDTHVIHQGGERALMPMLYALGQHAVLLSLQDFLLLHEHVFACLDDIYVV